MKFTPNLSQTNPQHYLRPAQTTQPFRAKARGLGGLLELWITPGFELDDPVNHLGNRFLDRHLLAVFQGQDGLRGAFQEKDQIGIDIDLLAVQTGDLDQSSPSILIGYTKHHSNR